MKKLIFILITPIVLLFSSCNDWILEETPGVTLLEDYFTVGKTAIQTTNGAYVPLMWEYNNTYFPEWFIGDVASDDALKGGQSIADMADIYDFENFKTNSNNGFLLEYYRAQYQGIARCNLGLQQIPLMKTDSTMDARLQKRLIGELKFLRALYYFRLVRVFGGVPLTTEPISNSNDWKKPRATATAIYTQILADLADANLALWKKSD